MDSDASRQLASRVWLESVAAPARIEAGTVRLGQVPSRAFGDGSHPTTQLCTHVVDLWCRTRKPASVLDIGTGTGVLARVARARGATRVRGTDIDPEALRAARANVALDTGTPDTGALDTPGPIAIDAAMPDAAGAFALVVANILEGPLTDLAGPIAAAVEPGGTLLLSGFTALQVPRLTLAYETQGLRVEQQASHDGWCLLRLSRPV